MQFETCSSCYGRGESCNDCDDIGMVCNVVAKGSFRIILAYILTDNIKKKQGCRWILTQRETTLCNATSLDDLEDKVLELLAKQLATKEKIAWA